MTKEASDPRQRFVRLAAAVRQQRKLIGRVVGEAKEALVDFDGQKPPPRELRGIGAIVHDFYTGIEHLFERIAPELNGGLPAGPSWHRELLDDMTLDLPGVRPPVKAPKGEELHFAASILGCGSAPGPHARVPRETAHVP